MPQTQSKSYTQEDMMAACATYETNGNRLREAARRHGVPASTLKDRLRGKKPNKEISRTVLTQQEESRLSDWIIECARRGYGRTAEEVKSEVQKILNGRMTSSKFTNNRPGRAWMSGFLDRHPEISKRTPQGLGIQSPSHGPADCSPAVPSTSYSTPSLSLSDPTNVPSSSASHLNPSPMSLVDEFDRILELTAKAGIDGLVRYRAKFTLGVETHDPEELLYRKLFTKLRGHLSDIDSTTGQTDSDSRQRTFENLPLPCRQVTIRKVCTIRPPAMINSDDFRKFVPDVAEKKQKVVDGKEKRKKERKEKKQTADDAMKEKEAIIKKKKEERERLKKLKEAEKKNKVRMTAAVGADNDSMTASKCNNDSNPDIDKTVDKKNVCSLCGEKGDVTKCVGCGCGNKCLHIDCLIAIDDSLKGKSMNEIKEMMFSCDICK